MRHTLRAALAVAVLAGLTSLAQAKVKIDIDLDTQTMHVDAGGKTFNWKVSSGKFGYETPAGTYKVLWTDKDHHSDTYDQAPMPNAIFFAPGYAIHGASKSSWGHPASHGCVRLPVGESAMLFDMVKKQGAEITLTGGSEANAAVAEKLKHRDDDVPPPVDASAQSPDGYAQGGYSQYGYDRPTRDDGYQAAPQPQQPAMSGYSPVYGQVY